MRCFHLDRQHKARSKLDQSALNAVNNRVGQHDDGLVVEVQRRQRRLRQTPVVHHDVILEQVLLVVAVHAEQVGEGWQCAMKLAVDCFASLKRSIGEKEVH